MKRIATIAITCGLSFTAGIGVMWAQQQQKSHRDPQFENGQMEAHYSLIMPHDPLTYHRHDHGRAIVALTDAVLKVEEKGTGKVLHTYVWKKNHAYWLDKDPPNQLHADVNDTDKPIEVMVVELRGDDKK